MLPCVRCRSLAALLLSGLAALPAGCIDDSGRGPVAPQLASSQDLGPGTDVGGVGPSAVTLGSIIPLVTETGKISLSVDGNGTLASTGTIQVEKPVGATVRGAWIAAASTGFSGFIIPNGGIKIDGQDVVWDVVTPSSISSSNHFAKVTDLVKPKLDAAPAGRVNFEITEVSSAQIDGSILAVIFDDPNQTTENTVVLLFGAQAIAGDHFAVNLAKPIDTSDPNLKINMGLGISFGFQPTNQQVNLVDVNGKRLTSCAGGQDDGEGANGALLTVGGLDDSNANPDPNCSGSEGPRIDDELYNLVPFVSTGDKVIDVFTTNPSNDDNIFFASFFMTVQATTENHPPVAHACITTDPRVAPFVRPSDPFPSACAHNAKVRGYITPPNTFPPKIEVRGDSPGNLSSDPDGDPLTFRWTEGATVVGVEPTVDLSDRLGPGEHTVTLTVDDGRGGLAQDQVHISVPELVILVHGWNSNPDDGFVNMGQLLGNHFIVTAFNYSASTWSVTSPVTDLSRTIQSIALTFADFTNHLVPNNSPYYRRIDILAHSMGGLVVRTYISGLAGANLDGVGGVPYRGEFNRIVTAGTPNYGAIWAALPSAILADLCCPQEHQMEPGSAFLWDLNKRLEAWPIPATNVLGIVGSVSQSTNCSRPLDGRSDAFVDVVSATLPPAAMNRVLYWRALHSGIFDGSPCPEQTLVGALNDMHITFEAVRNFFDASIAFVPPPDPRPAAIIGNGLLVVRVVDGSNNVISFTNQAAFELRKTGGFVARCGNTIPANVDRSHFSFLRCVSNGRTGIWTLLDLPQGTWTLQVSLENVSLRGRVLRIGMADVTIVAGRPSQVQIQLP